MQPKHKRVRNLILVLLSVCCLCGLPLLYYAGRPIPREMREEMFPGITYYRRVHFTPHLMVAHILAVDLTTPDLRIIITPGDPDADQPLTARTTSQFLDEFGATVAINGSGFTPWYSYGLFDFYPHVGDPVTPIGLVASQGVVYSQSAGGPVLYLSERNLASFNLVDGSPYNAIAGDRMLVVGRTVVEGLDDGRIAPRTAVGIDAGGARLIFIIIDGRQAFYSQGATLAELAELMLYYGSTDAMSLDGGGSSTMVVRGPLGPQVMNSPIDANIPGRERPVATHIGVYVP
ncbi:MAG: phosphodiester glycosidase family protein [Anaerolineales bacterium]|nr:phosphodiester glycosidase family protein [Anaerolineales bacterium]